MPIRSEEFIGQLFPLVVVDECTQATEPATCSALNVARGPVVVVGDPAQLPPTCLSEGARRGGLGRSLFERLHASGLEARLLSIQYRMP